MLGFQLREEHMFYQFYSTHEQETWVYDEEMMHYRYRAYGNNHGLIYREKGIESIALEPKIEFFSDEVPKNRSHPYSDIEYFYCNETMKFANRTDRRYIIF